MGLGTRPDPPSHMEGGPFRGKKVMWLVAARGDGGGPSYSATEAEKARRTERCMLEKGFGQKIVIGMGVDW